MSASESVLSKSAHKSMFSSAQKTGTNWNQDIVLDVRDICSYASDYIMANGENISNFEKSMFDYIRTPG